MDVFHIVCAEKANVDILLTVDYKLVKKSKAHSEKLKVLIENPVVWLQEVMK